jgi:DNA-binding transcriptional LysR family regulator
MGVLLVDRHSHKIELTAMGRVAVAQARHVIADADALERMVSTHARYGTDRLRLGMSATPMHLLAAPLLQQLAVDRPLQVLVKGSSIATLLESLRERRLDALVVETHAVSGAADLTIEPVAALRTGFLVRVGHPLSRRRRVGPDDLLAYPIVSTNVSDSMATAMTLRHGSRAHPDLLVRGCCEDIHTLLRVTMNSDAIYMGVLANGQHGTYAQTLTQLRFDTKGFEASFGLVRLAGRAQSAAMKELVKIARQHLRDGGRPARRMQPKPLAAP